MNSLEIAEAEFKKKMKIFEEINEPRLFYIGLRAWTIFIGISLIIWSKILIILTAVNFYAHDEEFRKNVDLWVVVVTYVPWIVAGAVVIVGGGKRNEALVSIGMYFYLEVNVVYFMIFLRNYSGYSRNSVECYGTWISFGKKGSEIHTIPRKFAPPLKIFSSLDILPSHTEIFPFVVTPLEMCPIHE